MICNDFATHSSIFIVLHLFYLRNRKQQKRQISKLIDCINRKSTQKSKKPSQSDGFHSGGEPQSKFEP